MVVILLHSSKTMRTVGVKSNKSTGDSPMLFAESKDLSSYLKTLSSSELQRSMSITKLLAEKTRKQYQMWGDFSATLPAIDIFLGDIYSGLQASSFTPAERKYANEHLFILSGLYGVLRALDEIQPYRLEMGYKLPGNTHDQTLPNITSLYEFWGYAIAQQLPKNQPIINLSAKEYTKAVFPYFKNIEGLQNVKIISPKFLTISPKTGEATFVTVHAKITRGAYARWLIQHRIEDLDKLKEFNDLGYHYSKELSTEEEPVFVAKEFKGLGLSIRLTK
ncbi:MAG: YaaA family protein [Candidatus Saccharimonadaceae bacterium]